MSIDNQGGKQETQEVKIIFMGLFWLQNISFEKMLAAKIIISALLRRPQLKNTFHQAQVMGAHTQLPADDPAIIDRVNHYTAAGFCSMDNSMVIQ